MHELVLRTQNGDQRNDFPSVSQCKLVVAEIHRRYSFKMNIQKKKKKQMRLRLILRATAKSKT